MRVGFVLHLAKRDGAGFAFLELLEALHGRGIEPVVLVPSGGPLVADIERRSVEVVTVPYRWWAERGTPWWKRGVRTGWNLLTVAPACLALRARRCEAVVTNTITVVTGALAAKLLGLPHVWYVHELWGGASGLRFDVGEGRSLKLLDRLSTVCVAASRTVAAPLAAALDHARVEVLYQAVTSRADSGGAAPPAARPSPDTLLCVVVGVLHPIKRQADAIRALSVLLRQRVRAELWLVGEGEPAHVDSLRRLALAEGVADATRFLGFREDPEPFQRAADVVLSCCPIEGLGRSTVEGMLAGKPVVAARGGGNDELVREGLSGLLYEAGNHVDLAARLARLAADPAEGRRLGEEGRRWASATFARARYGEAMAAILFASAGRPESR